MDLFGDDSFSLPTPGASKKVSLPTKPLGGSGTGIGFIFDPVGTKAKPPLANARTFVDSL